MVNLLLTDDNLKKFIGSLKLSNEQEKFLLDELPQLFNVFIGNMSAVGPRPALPNEVVQYGDAAKRRLLIKPGVTGLWQISGRSDVSFNDYVQMDVYYLEHWSVWLDIKILLLTFRAVFQRKGSY